MRALRTRTALGLIAALVIAIPASAAAEPRIVGGATTTIGEWPWQVAVADPPSTFGGDGFDRFFCGGSLVAPNVVLTAAHCVFGGSSFNQPASSFSVISGRTKLSTNLGQETSVGQVYYFVDGDPGSAEAPAIESQSAPGQGDILYNDNTSEWDVALLNLTAAAAAPAAPIQIAASSEASAWEPDDPAVVTGWGATSEGGSASDTMREAHIDIVSDANCGSAGSYGSDFIAETMVCAGIFPAGGKDTCQGDSGGPLVVPVGGGVFRLVGDTSWGFGCAEAQLPGIYGRLAADPMRSALATGIPFAATGAATAGPPEPPPPPAPIPDSTPPETTITKHPHKRGFKRRATFTFTATEPASFECRLDGKPFASCASPFAKRVSRRHHTFAVRATDNAENVDATPASFKWKVKRRRR